MAGNLCVCGLIGVMANPAKMLIDLFSNWKFSKGTNGISSEESTFEVSIQGGILIKELSDFIESTAGTSVDLTFYRPELMKWARVIGLIATRQTAPSSEIDEVIFMLRTLEPHFDKLTVSSTEEEAVSISQTVDELTRIITSDPNFPDDLKRYCFKVFEAVRHDLSMFETLEEFDLQESIDRLIATTSRLAAHYNESSSAWDPLSKVWKNLINLGKLGKGMLEVTDSGNNVLTAITQGS